jgi:hypothetical protein
MSISRQDEEVLARCGSSQAETVRNFLADGYEIVVERRDYVELKKGFSYKTVDYCGRQWNTCVVIKRRY